MFEPTPALCTYAFLRVTHSRKDPPVVTEIMQISPSRIHLREGNRVLSQWILSSENHLSTKFVAAENHLKWLLDELGLDAESKISNLKRLGFQVDMRVRIIMRAQSSNSFIMSPEIVRRISKLDVLFMCDFDCVSEDAASSWEKTTLWE